MILVEKKDTIYQLLHFLTEKKYTIFKGGRPYSFVMSWKQMKSYYGNLCCVCHKIIYEGSPIFWNNDGSSRVKHYDCSSNTRGARAITVPEESVDSTALSWGVFPIISEEENHKSTSRTVPEESVDSSVVSSELFTITSEEEIDEIFEKKSFEQRKQEREFFREGISP
jgi:hypothetical protein